MNKVYKPVIICVIVCLCALAICAISIIIGVQIEEDGGVGIPFYILGGLSYVAAMVSGMVTLRFGPQIRKYKEQMELENLTNRYQKYIEKMNEWEKQLDEKLKKYNLTFKEFYENADSYRHQRIVSSIVFTALNATVITVINVCSLFIITMLSEFI